MEDRADLGFRTDDRPSGDPDTIQLDAARFPRCMKCP